MTMFPTYQQCQLIQDKYQISSVKKIHLEMVTKTAVFLGRKLQEKGIEINLELLEAAGMLHDIDNSASETIRSQHPQEAVKIIQELGFPEVAAVVSKHALHMIIDPSTAPQTWEEKLLFLADKMVKYEIIGVEHRFALWRRENLPEASKQELEKAYPKVKQLENETFKLLGITIEDIKEMAVNEK